jgi:hypothetical protein
MMMLTISCRGCYEACEGGCGRCESGCQGPASAGLMHCHSRDTSRMMIIEDALLKFYRIFASQRLL